MIRRLYYGNIIILLSVYYVIGFIICGYLVVNDYISLKVAIGSIIAIIIGGAAITIMVLL